jgi:hypothetical protein
LQKPAGDNNSPLGEAVFKQRQDLYRFDDAVRGHMFLTPD